MVDRVRQDVDRAEGVPSRRRSSPPPQARLDVARSGVRLRTYSTATPIAVARMQSVAGNRATGEFLAAVAGGPTRLQNGVQRKGGGGGGTAKGTVGIPGGESTTPSDQTPPDAATGYVQRPDGQYDTPDGRTISAAQAKDESAVINSSGIYMAAYMARYNKVKDTYSLTEPALEKLSRSAGFLKQFKTGDVVLRMMDASDSEGLARITKSQYSHAGIIKVESGRVMVLDSYPRGTTDDASILTTFEDFFSDHHGEKIVNALVLRANKLDAATRTAISDLIDKYDVEHTEFDFDFRADNGADVMYCSELVTRVLRESGAANLPANEFDETRANVNVLIAQLKALIKFQEATGTDTSAAEGQLSTLTALVAKVSASSVKELVSPGSLERAGGFDAIAGFGRGAEIKGTFKVTVLNATVPDGSLDTPDPYVILGGGLSGKTSVQDDTTTPSWGQSFTGFRYDDLADTSFQIKDSDLIWDDDIATVQGDIRPVNPAGQTFTLTEDKVTLRVKTEAEGDAGSVAGQGPRDTTPL